MNRLSISLVCAALLSSPFAAANAEAGDASTVTEMNPGRVLFSSRRIGEGCRSFGVGIQLRNQQTHEIITDVVATQLGQSSDFLTHNAWLYHEVLAPGRYEFIYASQDDNMRYDDPRTGFEFQVAPGEALYLGEMAFKGCGVVYRWLFDSMERDLNQYRAQGNKVKKKTFTARLMAQPNIDPRPWSRDLEKETRKAIEKAREDAVVVDADELEEQLEQPLPEADE